MIKNKSRYIPTKNYIIAGVMLAGVIFLFVYAFMWYDIKNEEELLQSYLIETNTINLNVSTLEELESIMAENPGEFFIFTGYTMDEYERELEKDLKPIIDNYALADMFYYFNITDLRSDDTFLNELSELLNIEIDNFPTIIYFDNGQAVNKVDKGDNNNLEADDFKKLLEMYEFEKSN